MLIDSQEKFDCMRIAYRKKSIIYLDENEMNVKIIQREDKV